MGERRKERGIYEKVPGSNVWWIEYFVHGKRKREKAGTKAFARKLVAQRKSEAWISGKVPELARRRKVLFGELLDDALDHCRSKNSTRAAYEFKLKADYIRAKFGLMPAETITRQDIAEWLNKQQQDRKWRAATFNCWQAALSLCFRVGIENEKVERNPTAGMRRKTENIRARHLTPAEVDLLRRLILKRYPQHLAAFDISLHTGMRLGEQLSLRWNQIDWDRKQLTLLRTKNGRIRHIPLNEMALQAFRSLHINRRSEWIFVNKNGAAMKDHRGWFGRIQKEAGLEGYVWHVNRHTFASRLSMGAVDLRTIAELMGHTSIQMTMRYAHLAPEHQANAVAVLCKGQVSTATETATDVLHERTPCEMLANISV